VRQVFRLSCLLYQFELLVSFLFLQGQFPQILFLVGFDLVEAD
jgi:hypothetical protein